MGILQRKMAYPVLIFSNTLMKRVKIFPFNATSSLVSHHDMDDHICADDIQLFFLFDFCDAGDPGSAVGKVQFVHFTLRNFDD